MCADRPHCRTGLIGGFPTVRWVDPPPPYGCRWCGRARRDHPWVWVPSAGVHGWVAPTQAQLQARLRVHLAAARKSREERSL